MKKPEKTIILLTLFTIITLISVITVYAVYQNPTQETTTNTLCTYTSTATYYYTATLEPNTIYNNRTTLKPSEGTLYTKITKQINISLTYTFQANLPTETTITYSLAQILKTAALQYETNATTQRTTNQTQIQITIPPIKTNELETLKNQIQTEIGASSSTCAVEITPTFTISANTTVSPIHQIFTPTLLINFKHTDQGNIITIDNLHQTKTDAITENQTITRHDTINQRYASYVLITISIAGLVFSTRFYIKAKPKTKKISLEKILAPYKDLIIETHEQPKIPPETTTINIETIKELVKTAEILAKPMILTRKPEPTLIIIDQNIVYKHKTQ
jgi:hypothetical protein